MGTVFSMAQVPIPKEKEKCAKPRLHFLLPLTLLLTFEIADEQEMAVCSAI